MFWSILDSLMLAILVVMETASVTIYIAMITHERQTKKFLKSLFKKQKPRKQRKKKATLKVIRGHKMEN